MQLTIQIISYSRLNARADRIFRGALNWSILGIIEARRGKKQTRSKLLAQRNRRAGRR